MATALARSARGGAVLLLGQLGKVTIQFTGVIILSRLLEPADFGLVAMVAVVMSLGDLLRDFGLPTAALGARDLSHQQASNLFWLNSLFGLTGGLLVAASAPLLAGLYGDHRLLAIAPMMAIALVINGVQAQTQVQLARAGRFASLAVTDVTAQALGLLIACLIAVGGGGYWALVLQAVSTSTALLVGRTVVSRWGPARYRRGHGSLALLRAGGAFGLAQLLTFGANNMDTIVLGWRFGPSILGQYNRAFQFFMIPRTFQDPLIQVVVPSLNQHLASKDEHYANLLRMQSALGAIVIGTYLVAASGAEIVIPWLIGPEWKHAAEIFKLLAIGGCFTAFGNISYWSFVLAGEARQLLYLHLVTKPITIGFIIIAAPHGPEAVALAYSASLATNWPVNLLWLSRRVGQPSLAFAKNGALLIAAGIAGYFASVPAGHLSASLPRAAQLAVLTATAGATYGIGLLLVPHSRHLALHAAARLRLSSRVQRRRPNLTDR